MKLQKLALGGCLILAAVSTAPILAQQQDGGGETNKAQEAINEDRQKPIVSKPVTTYFDLGLQVDRHTYAAICEQPKDREHADLCQQWRVAEAAEWQIALTILGLVLLFGTLAFTAIAANAARAAVIEASKGTKA